MDADRLAEFWVQHRFRVPDNAFLDDRLLVVLPVEIVERLARPASA
jgi:hypothetical protein